MVKSIDNFAMMRLTLDPVYDNSFDLNSITVVSRQLAHVVLIFFVSRKIRNVRCHSGAYFTMRFLIPKHITKRLAFGNAIYLLS